MSLLAAVVVGACCALVARTLVERRGVSSSWGRRRFGGALELWLAQAGLSMRPYQFVAGSSLAGLLAFAAAALVTGSPFVAAVPAFAVALLPRSYFGRRRGARLRELQRAWPDGLRDLSASITAGHSLTQALVNLADTGPVPLRVAFASFPRLTRMLGTVPALEVIKEEIADPTSDRVIEVLVLASERGGAVVRNILDDLVVTTTKDVKLLEEIESDGLEMKINARAVLVMPWLVLVALTIRGGAFRDFYRSGGGVVVILVGAGLSALGALWIGRLGRQHEEQRVFGAAEPGVAT